MLDLRSFTGKNIKCKDTIYKIAPLRKNASFFVKGASEARWGFSTKITDYFLNI